MAHIAIAITAIRIAFLPACGVPVVCLWCACGVPVMCLGGVAHSPTLPTYPPEPPRLPSGGPCPNTQTPKHPNTQTPKHPNTQAPKHPNTQTPKHPDTQTPKHPNTQAPKHLIFRVTQDCKKGMSICITPRPSEFHKMIASITKAEIIYSKEHEGGTLYALIHTRIPTSSDQHRHPKESPPTLPTPPSTPAPARPDASAAARTP